MVQAQHQQSDDARKAALIKQLTRYLQRLQKLLHTIQYGKTDKMDIEKATVDDFNSDLTEIAEAIDDLRPVQQLLHSLPWVDSLSDKIESARDALRMVGFLLEKPQTVKSVKVRLDAYKECQNALRAAIDQLSKLIR